MPGKTSNLVPCHECGALISPGASACVKCRTVRPFPLCALCLEPVKPSSITLAARGPHDNTYVSRRYHRYTWALHPECVRQMLPLRNKYRVRCSACEVSLKLPYPTSDDPMEARSARIECRSYSGGMPNLCGECGETNYLQVNRCHWCNLWIFPGDPGDGRYYHEACDEIHLRLKREADRESRPGCFALALAAGGIALVVTVALLAAR